MRYTGLLKKSYSNLKMSKFEQNIQSVVKSIKKSKFNDIPFQVLRAEQMYKSDTVTDIASKKEICWTSGLMELATKRLFGDFLKVDGGYKSGARVLAFIVETVKNIPASEFLLFKKFLENLVEATTRLIKNILDHCAAFSTERNADLDAFKSVVASSNAFFANNHSILGNFWLCFNEDLGDALIATTMLISMDLVLVTFLNDTLKRNHAALLSLSRRNVLDLWELVYARLLRGNDSAVSKISAQFCIEVFKAYPLCLQRLQKNYCSSVDQVSKKWKGKDMESEILQLKLFLTGNVSATLRRHKAARTIQAQWRVYKAVRSFAKMKRGFQTLQIAYKHRHAKAQKHLQVTALNENAALSKKLERERKGKVYQQKRLQAISCLHPSLVDKFLASEADDMATRIQSLYRGHAVRKKQGERKEETRRIRAAIAIQRKYRQRIQRNRLAALRLKEWPGLTELKREILQQKIDSWNEQRSMDRLTSLGTKIPAEEQLKTVHEECQNHLRKKRADLKSYQATEALLTKMQLDVEVLENAPKLSEATAKDAFIFKSYNRGVSMEASKMFRNRMKALTKQWWENLDDDNSSDFL